MPAREATEDAVALLEKRRLQNRQAQARFRQKKLAQQAAANSSAPSGSGTSSAAAAAAATTGKRRRASPQDPQQPARGDSTGSEGGYVGSMSTSPTSSSSRSGPESDKASSPSTSSTSPSSTSDGSALSPTSYFASLPAASAQPQANGLPVFSYPEATPKAPTPPTDPYAGMGSAPLNTQYASFDDYLGDTISSSAAMPVDNEVQYFACVMREAEEEQRKEQERKQALLQRQQMLLQQFPQRQAGGGMAYGGLDDLLADLGVGPSLAPGLSAPTPAPAPAPTYCPDAFQQQPALNPQDVFAGLKLSPWKATEQLTQERGMLAFALLQTGATSVEQLRKAVFDPTRCMTFNPKNVMAQAFFHNAVTLGFLDNDLRRCHSLSNITEVWNARSVPFVQEASPGGGMTLFGGGSSGSLSPRSLTAPNTQTRTATDMWRMPIALSQTDEERRIDRLREAPNMYPTHLQLTRPHSIMVDILPWPNVRDGLIQLLDLGIIDSNTVKRDLLGKPFEGLGDGRTFTIHGNDPMDPEAWEMSEYWAQKYVPLLDRAMVRRTNFWRRMEGKEPLRLDVDREEGVDRTVIDALAKMNMAGAVGA